jgi:hypothetical protein
MDAEMNSMTCPVCGFSLDFLPWDGESSSQEICPCCGIQFGYDDAGPDGADGRPTIYEEWRRCWIGEAMPWRSVGQPRPVGWNPVEQLKKLG